MTELGSPVFESRCHGRDARVTVERLDRTTGVSPVSGASYNRTSHHQVLFAISASRRSVFLSDNQ